VHAVRRRLLHSFARARPYCAQEMRTMRMSNEEYAAFVDSLSPRSPIWGDLLRAGLVGGAICVVGQALVNLYEHWGASAATAATWCSITLVFLGALLTGLGVYDDLARFAGVCKLRGVPSAGIQDRGLRHGHGGQDLHDRRAGDRLRHQHKRDLRADPGRLRTGLTRRNT